MGKMPEVIFVNWLSWKRSNTHAYQVSPPCIVWCASLRSEEAVIGKVPEANFFVNGCHGNAQIHMCTKFHLHALHGLQV